MVSGVVRLFLTAIGIFASLSASFGAAAQDRPPIEIVSQLGHSSAVWSVAISPDGRFALSGSEDYTLKLWDIATARELRVFSGHTGFVSSVAFSPDGRFALSGSWDDTVKLWEVSTGKEVRSFTGHTSFIESVAFSPDGRFALSGGQDKTLKLWDLATGRELRSFNGHTGVVWSVAFSPDGKSAVSGSADETAKLWDVSTGQELRTFSGHAGFVWRAVFSPDGRFLLFGNADKTMKLWEVATGRELRSFSGHTNLVSSVAFSPDGRFILSSSKDKTLKLWDAQSGEELRRFTGHGGWARQAVFAPDGLTAVSGGDDGALKLWELATGKELRNFGGHMGSVSSVAFSPDGQLAITGSSDRTIRLWDLTTGKKLLRDFAGHAASISAVAFSPDGKLALSASHDKTLKLWEIATGKELRSFNGHETIVTSVAFSPDGRFALSGSGQVRRPGASGKQDNSMRLWDVATGKELRRFDLNKRGVRSVAFSPDGHVAACGTQGGSVHLWNVESGEELRSMSGRGSFVDAVVFSPDGRFVLSGSWDKTLTLWDAASGQELRSFDGHAGAVVAAAFSPDGRFALSGSQDNTIKLWEVATGKELRTFKGHSAAVQSVKFSPDGRSILSGSYDGTTRIWALDKGEELARMMATSDGEWLTITPKGFFAASVKGGEMLSVVRGYESYSVLQFYEHLARPDLVTELLKGDLEGKYRSAANSLNLETILNSGSAPKLERLYDRDKREGNKATLVIRLTDRGGGIGEKVIWRINGVAQGTTTAPDLGGPVSPSRYAVMEQTLRFDPTQRNEVEVVAHNGRGLLATLPLRFTIDPVFGITDKPIPRLFVLAVGVDKYLKPDWRLSNAVNDAKTIGDALKTVGHPFFGENNVEVTTVLDENATEAGIGAAFEQIASKIEPQDVFILFLSGHGRAIAGSGPGTGWFFLPQNLNLGPQTVAENAIGSALLDRWLRRISALKSLIVLDACESGAFEAPRGADLETETTVAQFTFATGRSTISAAPQGKAAYEGYKGHGILTYAILEALNKGEGQEDETIGLLEVGAYINKRVIDISRAEFGIVQTPRTDLKNDFTFGIREAVLKPVAVECKLPEHPMDPATSSTGRSMCMLSHPTMRPSRRLCRRILS